MKVRRVDADGNEMRGVPMKSVMAVTTAMSQPLTATANNAFNQGYLLAAERDSRPWTFQV